MSVPCPRATTPIELPSHEYITSGQRKNLLEVDFTFQEMVSGISDEADHRDINPSFPEHPFRQLARSGVLAMPVTGSVGAQGHRASFAEEWRVLRAMASADGSVGRILDGHLNGVERVSLLAPEPLRSDELAAVAAGELRVGGWDADPIPGEGDPARLVSGGGAPTLSGVKTF